MGVLKSICFNGMCNEIPDMLSFEVVDQLPETGTGGIIYLVPNAGAYDEYVWTDDGFFKIGTTNEVSVEEIEREIRELKETKANIDGYYPNLHVGTADQLLADTYTTDEEPYHYRATPSNAGTREIDEIVGGSVVWNQYTNLGSTETMNGITFTKDGGSYVLSGTADGLASKACMTTTNIYKGHKYLLLGGASNDVYAVLTNVSAWDASKRYDYGTGRVLESLIDGTATAYVQVKSGTTVNNLRVTPQFHDLTAMFGTTIADYIYSLEQATAGTGVEFFRKYFPDNYYAYDAGELMHVGGLSSHVTVGKNLLDISLESQTINEVSFLVNDNRSITINGTASTNVELTLGEFRLQGGVTYRFNGNSFPNTGVRMQLKAVGDNTSLRAIYNNADESYTPAKTGDYIMTIVIVRANTASNHTIYPMVRVDGAPSTYEPYQKHTYPLDNSVTLRGIPQFVNGQLKWNGDTYSADGVVTRRYGIVDLGTISYGYTGDYFYTSVGGKMAGNHNLLCTKYTTTLAINASEMSDKQIKGNASNYNIYIKDSDYTDATTFKSAMSGVMLVYELATPTTEQAEPYQELQICSPYGTEKYVSTGIVPVGHYTKYPTDLKGIVEQIADAPSADGTYTLKATVSGGVVTYSWESA